LVLRAGLFLEKNEGEISKVFDPIAGKVNEALELIKSFINNILIEKEEVEKNILNLEKEIEKLKTLNDDLNHKLSTKDIQINEVEANIAEKDEQISSLKKETEELQTKIGVSERKIEEREKQIQAIETEKKELSEIKGTLQEELSRKAKEYDSLLERFSKISEEFSTLSQREKAEIDLENLLSVYVTLIEEIINAKPHIRILWLLHGEKQVMTANELAKASGFEPAVVLGTLHELARGDLVEFSLETKESKLKRRLFRD
jgi:chromosome segregation ATPase